MDRKSILILVKIGGINGIFMKPLSLKDHHFSMKLKSEL
jgi:hypothetical protein